MELSEAQRASLDALTRQDGYDGSVSARAQIVLWRADGFSVADIVRMSGASKPTVYKWVDRYERFGVDGLTDLPRSGRPPEVPDSVRSRIVALTRCTPPAETGLSHWSSRAMATYLKRTDGIAVSHNFIAQVWRDHDLQPHRQGTFKLSTDPDFEAKVADVVGLYLDPPVGAVVLSIDEKTQVQALDRTQPVLPIDFAKTEKRTHDYVRHGTTNLFAALDTVTGHVLGQCYQRRRTAEFLRFMDTVVARYGEHEIHVVLDNLSTHKGDDVDAWLTRAPKRHLSLHPDRQFLVEPGRNLVQHHHQASDQARHIHLPPRPHQDNQAIHRELEPRRETLRVDSDSRRDHRQRQDSSPGLQEAVGQQLEVKPRPLRDTSGQAPPGCAAIMRRRVRV
jgi:transposase